MPRLARRCRSGSSRTGRRPRGRGLGRDDPDDAGHGLGARRCRCRRSWRARTASARTTAWSMPGQREVVDVAALAGDEAAGPPCADALADAAGGGRGRRWPCSGPRHLAGGLLDGARRCSGSRCSGRGCPRAPGGSRRRTARVGLLEQADRGHHHPRRAEAALQAVMLVERLLDRVQRRRSRARPSTVVIVAPSAWTASIVQDCDRVAVDAAPCSAALSRVAADVGAGEAEVLAQQVHEQRPRLHLQGVHRTVHRQRDLFTHRRHLPSAGLRVPRAPRS